jgi:hypothetical protein
VLLFLVDAPTTTGCTETLSVERLRHEVEYLPRRPKEKRAQVIDENLPRLCPQMDRHHTDHRIGLLAAEIKCAGNRVGNRKNWESLSLHKALERCCVV